MCAIRGHFCECIVKIAVSFWARSFTAARCADDKRENAPIARGKCEENNCKYSPIKLLGAFVIASIFVEWLVYLYGTINVLVSRGTATPARYIDIVRIAS